MSFLQTCLEAFMSRNTAQTKRAFSVPLQCSVKQNSSRVNTNNRLVFHGTSRGAVLEAEPASVLSEDTKELFFLRQFQT